MAMSFQDIIAPKSLLFAPMEGVTNEPYRLAIHEAFPEWDFYYTDFLRLPNVGKFSSKKVTSHYGEHVLKNNILKKRTGYQVLASNFSNIEPHLEMIEYLAPPILDLNLGCPSKQVTSSEGGSFLLSRPDLLKKILTKIRNQYQGVFTAKIRVGFENDNLFFDLLKLIEDCGVEAITIHGRTRVQHYEGRANWDYIKQAVEQVKIPIIGNGDIWTLEDIDNIFSYTNCYSIMMGRGAMKTPWMGQLYKEYGDCLFAISDEVVNKRRTEYIFTYYQTLKKYYEEFGVDQPAILRRFKALGRYLFDDYHNIDQLKTSLFQSTSIESFFSLISKLDTSVSQ